MKKQVLRLALTVLLAAPVFANSALQINFGQLSNLAGRVVAGRILKITSAEDPKTGNIFSTVTMSVAQAVPEQLVGREYTFRMIGGVTETRQQYIADYPPLESGKDVLLFLNTNTAGVFGPTVGLGQGVFYLQTDKVDNIQRVTDRFGRPVLGIRDQRLIRGVARTGDAMPSASGETKARPAMRVEEFFEQVRSNRGLALTR